MRSPATVWPPMRVVGRADSDLERLELWLWKFEQWGSTLTSPPVADVDSNPANPVIGDRSFGRDPDEVARRVVQFIHAHQAERYRLRQAFSRPRRYIR